MYENEDEIKKKRRTLLIGIGVVVFLIILLIIFLVVRGGSKKKPTVVSGELNCELGVKDDIQPNSSGVYTQEIEVIFKSVSPENETWKKKTIGTADNSRNQETYKITKSGTYVLHGYLQDSTGRKKQCEKTFTVSLSKPSCELEVKKGTLGTNEWYKSDVEVGFATMKSGSDSASIVKYYIEKEVVDLNTQDVIRAEQPNENVEKYTVKDDQTTTLIGYVIDSSNAEGTCTITIKKDSTKPTCKLKVVSGKPNSSGVYTDEPVVGFSETKDTVSDIAEKGVGTKKNYKEETYKVTADGTTKVTGYVKDNAGNEGTCTLQVKRPGSTSGGGGSSASSKPTCTLSVSGTKSGSSYIGNATVTIKTSTTNGATVKSYGLGESKATNGKSQITLTSAGSHTVYGTVTDSNGNTGSCKKTITIKGGSLLSAKVKAGDYVAYDAGTWGETAPIPTKEGNFGGYTSGSSRSKGVNCLPLQEGTPEEGWRVLSVSNGKVTLVHAGTPECYYHNKSTATSIGKINARASTYLNSTYAESARILNCGDQGVTCTQGTKLSSVHVTNTHYYLPTAKDGSSSILWAVSYTGRVTGTSQRAYGIRPVVVLKSSITSTSGTGTKADPYKLSK